MRIAGITIPEDKRLEIGLTAVYGVGRSRARNTLSEVGIDPGKLPKDLSESEEASVREAVEKFAIEGELRRMISGNIRRLKDIHTYRGSRHAKHLPARGQGTKTNSRTVRGNKRVTMTSGRRKLEKT
ncbi:MAG: 30S ribosomal protein S13 [Patescibacteria group bacterium]|nr:30S ribosomal protein S13 [Patescibacteria group bacterium]